MDLSSILSDQELLDEISYRIKKGAYDPRFPILDRKVAIEAIDKIASGELVAIGYDIEAVVLEVGRPALIIKNGTFSVPESDIWKSRLEKSRLLIEKAIASVGRIEVKNHPGFEWIGTGWIVRENVVVTNRHVANEFGIKDMGGTFRFRRNFEGKEMGARIDLREEYMQPDEAEFRVVKVLHIEEPEGPDLAFLEVEFLGERTPEPIRLAENINPDAFVALIGYPAWDGRRNDPAVMRKIFNDIYDVKRLRPGKILTVLESGLSHDCSSLGGDSGSPLLDLSNGEAVGLHFAGSYLKRNSAVPAAIVKDRLNLI